MADYKKIVHGGIALNPNPRPIAITLHKYLCGCGYTDYVVWAGDAETAAEEAEYLHGYDDEPCHTVFDTGDTKTIYV